MANFICWQNPTTNHNPYPGVRISANSSQEAAQIFSAQVPSGVTFAVIPETTIVWYKLDGVSTVTAPAYV